MIEDIFACLGFLAIVVLLVLIVVLIVDTVRGWGE